MFWYLSLIFPFSPCFSLLWVNFWWKSNIFLSIVILSSMFLCVCLCFFSFLCSSLLYWEDVKLLISVSICFSFRVSNCIAVDVCIYVSIVALFQTCHNIIFLWLFTVCLGSDWGGGRQIVVRQCEIVSDLDPISIGGEVIRGYRSCNLCGYRSYKFTIEGEYFSVSWSLTES